MVTLQHDGSQAVRAWEPSAWMRQQATKALRAASFVATPATTVVVPLGSMKADGREDRTCDRCRIYVPPTKAGAPARFMVGLLEHRHILTGARVSLVFGLCLRCYAAEGSPRSGSVVA